MQHFTNKNPYFPNLDGLRFFCFLFVFFFHSFYTEYDYISSDPVYRFVKFRIFGNGNLGVNFFFVLSGFLITYLLIIEKQRTAINIKNFYIRRVLRIWPLFFFCVFFGFVLFPQFKMLFGVAGNETAKPLYYLLFINNFDFISNPPDSSVLSVLWSVAIEEQFYLVWPLLLGVIPVRYFYVIFFAVILQSIAFRFIYTDPHLHEYHTLSCIGDMAIGALGAWAMCFLPLLQSKIRALSKVYIWLLYFLVIAIFLFRKDIMDINPVVTAIERTLIAAIFLCVILEQNYADSSLFKLSRIPLITSLGKRTYGLYCLHFIGILFATTVSKIFHFNTSLWQILLVDTTVALFSTLLLAEISYRFYEKPFMRLKEKFG